MSRRPGLRPGRARGLVDAPPVLGRHQVGDSRLHRARAGPKLVGVAGLGLTVGLVRAFVPAGPAAVVLVLAAVAVAGLALGAGLGGRYLLTQVGRLRWVLLVLALTQAWLLGPVAAVAVVAGLVTCLWAAAVVMGTTPVPVLLDTVVRSLHPLRRVGLDPDHVGLTLVLTITSIPVVTGLLAGSRESALARGLERDPRAVLVPLLIRTVAHAEAVSEALAARGLDTPGTTAPVGDGRARRASAPRRS